MEHDGPGPASLQEGWSLEEQMRLRLAAKAAGIGVWEMVPGSEELFYDARAREICGFPPDGPVTLEMARKVTHPDDLPATSAKARAALLAPDDEAADRYRYRIIRFETGELRWVEAHAQTVFEGEGSNRHEVRYIGTLQDITEDKQTQDELAAKEASLQLAIDAGNLAVWELDPQKGSITHSPQLNLLFGFPEDATPTPDEYRARFAPGERDRVEVLGRQAIARGENKVQAELRLVLPGGAERWALFNAQVHPSEPGPGGKVIGTFLDITERKQAEQRLELVAREMRHRVKNTLTIVQAIATQTMRNAADIEDARHSLAARLHALSAGTDLLFFAAEGAVRVDVVADRILQPFRQNMRDPFTLQGPEIPLPGEMVIPMSLILHELATNALKYGALSTPQGSVEVAWSWPAQGGDLQLDWHEHGGPRVRTPEQSGFGSRLLERLSTTLGGKCEREYRREGFRFELVFPLGGAD